MAIAKSNTNDLASLFKEGYFRIPPYQRRYSWGEKQQLDLLKDLLEAFETKTKHFLGTLSLQLIETKGFDSYYNIIDGQQRFTTLLLLYACLANVSDDKRYLDYLKRNERYFLEPINEEEKHFLVELLEQKNPPPKTNSQNNMVSAMNEFKKRIKLIGVKKINDFLDYILNNTQFLIYLVDDYAASIRMFESINDRGMPLSYFDKLKSFFLYFSEKYLSREIDNIIHTTFDEIYSFFDNNKFKLGINNDDTLLLYHYLSNPSLFTSWAYTKSTENIFLDFKKYVFDSVQSQVVIGKNYIIAYLNDISGFISSCIDIEEKIKKMMPYKEFYFLLAPNQRMFPLSIRFNQIGILDDTINMLEKIEFYLKYRRDPKKDIFKLLRDVIDYKGTKVELIKYINNELYYIYEWQDSAIDIVNSVTWAARYSLYLYNKIKNKQIIDFETYKKLEVEHIFSQEPSFPIQNYGYDDESYHHMLNNIGNLTLLEPRINGPEGATNKPPEDKIKDDYINSNIVMTQEIDIKNIDDIKSRNREFEQFLNNYFEFELK
jgi:uncharacterized protein with ParB-like and HNH nuclease domain